MSNQEQARIQLIGRVSAQADKVWLDVYRELIASFNLEDVQKAMYAYIRLNVRQEIQEKKPNFQLYLEILEKTFLILLDRGAITPAASITSLGEKALESMRRNTGIGVETLPAPEPVLTPAQRLEVEIRNDWATLSGDQIRKKRNANRAYREMFESIAGTLDSQVTLHSVIGG